MAPLIPCAVVVDSRNLIGQSGRLFGAPANLSIAGIHSALACYGFEPVEIRVGTATRVLQEKCSDRVSRMLGRNQKLVEICEKDGAEVLHGYLVERAGIIEEKQVDVLCAVAIADLAERILVKASPAKCIISLSEDMDLMPAYDFAHARDVPVFAAAIDAVHLRNDQRSWILLDEAAVSTICPSTSRYRGMKLRSWIARMTQEDAHIPGLWTVGFHGRDGWEMSRNNGARGLWMDPDSPYSGKKVMLRATGVTTSPGTQHFPILELRSDDAEESFQNVELATVVHWTAQTRVRLELASGDQVTTRAPAGSLLPGQEVAVLRGPDGSQSLIGELDRATPHEAWPAGPRRRMIAVVTKGSVSRGWGSGRLEDTGQDVLIALKQVSLRERDRIAVTLVGEQWGKPAVHPLSTPLPVLQTP
ncbi:MAG: hypothetical protein KBG85_12450 [Micropruina sp.]|nr:hypothetical protein [Micropruina sp.]